MPLAERAKALKGKTIGIQGVGSIVHAWERLVASRGGLDIEKDVRIAPMDPSAMPAALETKSIDGYATSLPFTHPGGARWQRHHAGERGARRARSAPFAYGLVYTRPTLVRSNADKCARVARALAGANTFIHDKPPRRSICSRNGSTRWTPRCWRPPGRRCRRHMRRTCVVTGARPGEFAEGQPGGEAAEPKDALAKFDGLYTE
jgi:ABC-type nitrate/sulfonate/bicarbonate transport system substrate-binding protein